MLASDRSLGLASQAAQRLQRGASQGTCGRADVALADAMGLPYRRGVFDGALSIAVGHAAGACRQLHAVLPHRCGLAWHVTAQLCIGAYLGSALQQHSVALLSQPAGAWRRVVGTAPPTFWQA